MKFELKESDLTELYMLLQMYDQVYDSDHAAALLEEITALCRRRGIDPDRGNSRNAGRHKTISAQTDAQIMELRQMGLSIREIARQTNTSKSYVHELISGQ